jgi:hypothetical protein
MSKRIISIKLSEEMIDYIERLNFEKLSRSEIIKEIIRSADKFPYSKDMLDHYSARYSEAFAELNLVFRNLTDQYTPEEFRHLRSNIEAGVDFASETLTLSMKEGQKAGETCSQCHDHTK